MIGPGAFLVKDNPAVKAAAQVLTGTVKKVFADTARPMVQPIVDALATLNQLTVRIGPAFGKMFATAAPYLQSLVDGLNGMVENALPGFQSMLTNAKPLFDEVRSALPTLGEGFEAYFDAIGQAGPGAAEILRDLITILTGLVVATGKLVMFGAQAYHAVRGAILSTIDFFKAVPGALSEAWGAVSASFTSPRATFFTSLWTAVTSPWATASGWQGRLATPPPGVLRGVFVAAFDQLTFTVGYGIGLVVGFYARLPGRSAGALRGMPGAVSGAANSVYGAGQDVVRGMVNGIISMVGAVEVVTVRGVDNAVAGARRGLGSRLAVEGVRP